jgi:hypothetical protein
LFLLLFDIWSELGEVRLNFWNIFKLKQVGSGALRSLYRSLVKGSAFSRGAPLFNFVLATNHRVF